MSKIGRNQACPCGSGNKFKHCHGSLPAAASRPRTSDQWAIQADLEAVFKRNNALEFQRARQQGRGKSIISAEVNGTRFMAIGKTVAYGKWQTFPDFLLHHVKVRFGREWGQSEMAKSGNERHPFVGWLGVLGGLMDEHVTNPGGINSLPEYGAVRAVFGLAYDLYLIEHHSRNDGDERAFERLLDRLRHPDQFFGARHEARAAGILLRAGFNLSWEDEQARRRGGHAEFVATFPQTGRSFWIECKMRQPEDDKGAAKFTHLVSSALQKESALERLVFVELNLPDGRMGSEEVGGWPVWAINQLRVLEQQTSAAKLPSALILISNFPEHRYLDGLIEGAGALLEGFKTDEFRFEIVDLRAAIQEREKNPEIESLFRSMQEHSAIPTTFDGSIPGLDESRRLLIGQSYALPNSEVGVLEEATVLEQHRKAAGILRVSTGQRVMAEFDLSDEELDAWRRHPETFFGELRPHHPPANDAMDMFEFFTQAYAQTSKEQLLELMSEHADIEEMRGLPQPEVVKRYAYRLTATVNQRHELPVIPAWYSRIRRRTKPGTSG